MVRPGRILLAFSYEDVGIVHNPSEILSPDGYHKMFALITRLPNSSSQQARRHKPALPHATASRLLITSFVIYTQCTTRGRQKSTYNK